MERKPLALVLAVITVLAMFLVSGYVSYYLSTKVLGLANEWGYLCTICVFMLITKAWNYGIGKLINYLDDKYDAGIKPLEK